MSKTAREVMTPWAASHDDQAGDPASSHAIGADDWVDKALATMTELKVRRLPVRDGGRLVGTVSQGDLASSIEQPETWSWLCS
jgi:CBS domain-containing protein